MPVTPRPAAERFWEKVDLNGPPPPDPWVPIVTGCWLWTASVEGRDYKMGRGYGTFFLRKEAGRCIFTNAHRFAYELLVGPIPNGMTIDHLCRVTTCVNPDHLEATSNRNNILRGMSPMAVHARKTDCPQGHAYDEANTYVDGVGGRHCRMCRKLRARERSTNA